VCQQPPLLSYATEAEYRAHFEHHYCFGGSVMTCDGIPVYFGKNRFNHAFYESSDDGSGKKARFARDRAERMDWIRATLQSPAAKTYQGWLKWERKHSPIRRVAVLYEDFVVVIEIGKKKNGALKANFITAYCADLSIGKIEASPQWSLEAYRAENKDGR